MSKSGEAVMKHSQGKEIVSFTMTDRGQTKTVEMPILHGTMGPAAVDMRSFYQQTGLFSYDPGFTSTASCDSALTFIDGDEGVLLHQGYRIEDLADNCDFLEVGHLLLRGNLPNVKEYSEFSHNITIHSLLHEQLIHFYRGFRRDAHPMAIMVGVVGALSAFYHDSLDLNDPEQLELASYRLIAKMPTMAAYAYKYSIGQPFVYPQNDLNYAENFLHMMFSLPAMKYKVSPTMWKALNKIFILHADHEQNASTSTVRLASSSGANPFACIAAGIACLWGPAHGGANEAVLNMLQEIGTKDRIPEFIKRAKDKNDPFRLMGFGHRVYKNYDPRASVLRRNCHEVLEELGIKHDPLLELAMELERIALQDEYFVQKKLFPNVDFYSGIIFKAMGIPTSMFTVLFALARTVGWVSQWREMLRDPQQKIGRPRQLYVGTKPRSFVGLEGR